MKLLVSLCLLVGWDLFGELVLSGIWVLMGCLDVEIAWGLLHLGF